MPAVQSQTEMWQQFWHDAIRSLALVYFGLAIVLVITTIIRGRLDFWSKAQATYVLSDGGQDSVRRPLDGQLSEAERRRILSGYGVGMRLWRYPKVADLDVVHNACPHWFDAIE